MGDNIKTDRNEIGWKDAERIHLAQDRDKWRAVVNAVMNLLVVWSAGDLLASRATIRFSRILLVVEVSGQFHAPVALCQGKEPQVPIG
jgi:hypothetical protein